MVDRPRSGHDGVMTTSPPEAPQEAPRQGPASGGPRVSREQITDLSRLRRTRRDRKVAGVAGGLARHLDIDPVILRVAFVVLAFFGGAGIILYAAAWLLVPSDGSDDATINLDNRSRTVALTLVAVIALLALLGDSLGGWGFPWPLAIVGVIAFLIISRRGDRTVPTPQPATWAATGESPAGAPVMTEHRGYRPPPPNPRKRGPLLFWFTLVLTALSVGVLGILDLTGLDVTPSAYPATALGVTALMLLVGAFYGRAGGLILIGLVLAVATAGTTVAERVEVGDVERIPQRVADIDYTYAYDAADLEINLSRVTDPENLDGRTLDIDIGIGEVIVTVPDNVDVIAETTLDGFGTTRLFNRQQDGSQSATYDGGEDVPTLTVIIRAGIGELTVQTSEGAN